MIDQAQFPANVVILFDLQPVVAWLNHIQLKHPSPLPVGCYLPPSLYVICPMSTKIRVIFCQCAHTYREAHMMSQVQFAARCRFYAAA